MFNSRARSTSTRSSFAPRGGFGGRPQSGGFRGGGFRGGGGGFRGGRGGGGPKRVSDSTIHSYISRASMKPGVAAAPEQVFEEVHFESLNLPAQLMQNISRHVY